jgi:hypothetical protein
MFRSTKKKKKFNAGRRTVQTFDDNDNDNENDDKHEVTTDHITGDKKIKDDNEDQNDDEEEEPSALFVALQNRKNEKRNKKKGKGKGLVVRSFDVEEADDDDDDDDDDKKINKKKKHKKRKRGLGFGGDGTSTSDGNEDENRFSTNNSRTADDDKQVVNDDDDVDGLQLPSYGKDALERLKSEQKLQKISTPPPPSSSPPPPLSAVELSVGTGSSGNDDNLKQIPSESYISLDDDSKNNNILNGTVLTGEEADAAANYESYGRKDQENDKIFAADDHSLPPQESAAWEEQIERRAGIKTISTSSSSLSTSKMLSLEELSEKLKSTIQTIQTQREEFSNSTNRRCSDREQAMSESKTQQETLKNIGHACEFYQKTRRDITLWVGALRDLQEKVQPILNAFQEMMKVQNQDFDNEFLSWQDDCISTLQENDMLDRVLGRQSTQHPTATINNNNNNNGDGGDPVNNGIDEFGRDIRSQYLRDRDLRFNKRNAKIITIISSSVDINQSTDDTISTNDNKSTTQNEKQIIGDDIINRMMLREDHHNEDERSKTLHEALSVALEDLDQDYTSILQLREIFDTWFGSYCDDYRQCFATLSFGDLSAVLVQVEICKSNFFCDMVSEKFKYSSNSTLPSFPTELDCLLLENQGVDKRMVKENEGRLARAVEKGLLPMLTEILKENFFCLFFSSTKSSLISKLIGSAILHLHNSSSHRIQLQVLISTAIANSLDGIAIPILKKNDKFEDNQSADVSTRFANVYLVKILQRTLCNMIVYWLPLIPLDSSDGENGIHSVLNFINDKYLMILSSIVDKNNESSSAKTSFEPVWDALNRDERKFVESPSLMMLTMPLRAAAHAYQLVN